MNNMEAKFILQGYRPNGADAGDATFGAALEQTRLDPALGNWFAREQSFDRAISAKLGQIPAPAGLRETILAGGRVTAPDAARRNWWRQPARLAAAAGIALLFAAGLALWFKQTAADGALAEFVLNDTMHSATHGGHGEETGALQTLLSQPTTRLSGQLPVDFAALHKTGCRTVSFRGHDVLEVCFQRDGAWFHCYIARRADFPALVPVAPVFVDRKGASIASWADSAHLFVLVSTPGRAALQKLL